MKFDCIQIPHAPKLPSCHYLAHPFPSQTFINLDPWTLWVDRLGVDSETCQSSGQMWVQTWIRLVVFLLLSWLGEWTQNLQSNLHIYDLPCLTYICTVSVMLGCLFFHFLLLGLLCTYLISSSLFFIELTRTFFWFFSSELVLPVQEGLQECLFTAGFSDFQCGARKMVAVQEIFIQPMRRWSRVYLDSFQFTSHNTVWGHVTSD